ncbi:glutamate ABC transporter substrate-binding protein [Corynebacterium gallinarum]|uniref:Glutamate ABC transporter substrate-binding protein n=1 Tax=Corynebacterium gallinarum TaxID=2762214 RepID=A0A8I0HJM0_9CORY|nr:glutamate ABC transporter substrate-binding protein [Corynebacterium gallinarum]MBD8031273.1 glutamate ABC transporter substrate-binding protein [Corynebacterium gallinarum]
MKKTAPVRLLTAIGAAALAATLASCSSSESTDLLGQIESGAVTLGAKYDQPGLGLRSPDGAMSGLEVDISTYVVNSIADDNGWEHPEITWRETPAAQRETFIQNGEVAMIAATYSINQARLETVNFGGPFLVTHQALMVREDDDRIQDMDDLNNDLILCSTAGSVPSQRAKEAIPGLQLQEYDTPSSCIEALDQGSVDAITTDATILYGYAQYYPGDFRIVEMIKDGEQFTDEYYGIGLAKGDDEGTEAINTALQKMYDDGTFDRLLEANFGENPEVIEYGTPGDFTGIE